MCLYIKVAKTYNYFNTPQEEYLTFYKVLYLKGKDKYTPYQQSKFKTNVLAKGCIDKFTEQIIADTIFYGRARGFDFTIYDGAYHLYCDINYAKIKARYLSINSYKHLVYKCTVHRDDVIAFGRHGDVAVRKVHSIRKIKS